MKPTSIPTRDLRVWDVLDWGGGNYQSVESIEPVDGLGSMRVFVRRMDLDEPDELLPGVEMVFGADQVHRVISRGTTVPLRVVSNEEHGE